MPASPGAHRPHVGRHLVCRRPRWSGGGLARQRRQAPALITLHRLLRTPNPLLRKISMLGSHVRSSEATLTIRPHRFVRGEGPGACNGRPQALNRRTPPPTPPTDPAHRPRPPIPPTDPRAERDRRGWAGSARLGGIGAVGRRDVMALSDSPRGLCGLVGMAAQISHRTVALPSARGLPRNPSVSGGRIHRTGAEALSASRHFLLDKRVPLRYLTLESTGGRAWDSPRSPTP